MDDLPTAAAAGAITMHGSRRKADAGCCGGGWGGFWWWRRGQGAAAAAGENTVCIPAAGSTAPSHGHNPYPIPTTTPHHTQTTQEGGGGGDDGGIGGFLGSGLSAREALISTLGITPLTLFLVLAALGMVGANTLYGPGWLRPSLGLKPTTFQSRNLVLPLDQEGMLFPTPMAGQEDIARAWERE